MKKYKAPPKFHMEIVTDPPYTPGEPVTVMCNSFQLSSIITDTSYDEINRCIGWLYVRVQGEPVRFARLADGRFVADVLKEAVENGSVQAVQASLF